MNVNMFLLLLLLLHPQSFFDFDFDVIASPRPKPPKCAKCINTQMQTPAKKNIFTQSFTLSVALEVVLRGRGGDDRC